ncbi:MAG: hypothetical protein MZW92_59080 [Comamonadaceae bacterium]|nr:hypothetical protein [Comamonadaceae bacterium]
MATSPRSSGWLRSLGLPALLDPTARRACATSRSALVVARLIAPGVQARHGDAASGLTTLGAACGVEGGRRERACTGRSDWLLARQARVGAPRSRASAPGGRLPRPVRPHVGVRRGQPLPPRPPRPLPRPPAGPAADRVRPAHR